MQTHFVNEIFNFLLNQENLLQAFNENNIFDACKTFYDKLGNIDSFEMKELGRLYMPSTKIKKVLKQ